MLASPVLILFDIDGTLVITAGAGLEALCEAGRELYGSHFAPKDVSPGGRVDPDIVSELLRVNDVTPTRTAIETMRERYLLHLDRLLADGRPLTVLPGVRALIANLARRDGVDLGLLSGNFRQSAHLKLQHCGIDLEPFRVDAYGCDCDWDRPERRQLPPVAMNRHREATGRKLSGRKVVVVGDTPNDIDCARHHGLRSLAVATGWCSSAELAEAGADAVLGDLERTEEVIDLLLSDD